MFRINCFELSVYCIVSVAMCQDLSQELIKITKLLLGKTVGLSNKPVQINPKSPTGREKPAKFIRMSSLMEPVSPSPMSPSLFKTATDFDADVDDDCVDNAPIIKNVRSMVENFESPSGSPLSAIETAPAAKHRRYSGQFEI